VAADGRMNCESFEGLEMFDNCFRCLSFLEGELRVRVEPLIYDFISDAIDKLQ